MAGPALSSARKAPRGALAAPDFVVIGAMRAGTTMLQDLLGNCPDIDLPAMKETDYFVAEKNFSRGADWYLGQFRSGAGRRGDISPNYAKRDVFPGVAARIAAVRPDARIVYVLRDPVARAISQYLHSWLMGHDLPLPEDLPGSEEEDHILNTSRYDWQLEPWRDAFAADQLHLVDFTALTEQPEETLGALCTFIGVPPVGAMTEQGRRNSRDDVSRLPGWWRRARDTAFGQALRQAVPRQVGQRLKRLASSGQSNRTAPVLPDSLRARWADLLQEDAARLRASTGLSFSDWTV